MLQSAAHGCDEIIRIHIGLLENAAKRASLERTVHRDDTTSLGAAHNDVAAALMYLREAELFERLDALPPANWR